MIFPFQITISCLSADGQEIVIYFEIGQCFLDLVPRSKKNCLVLHQK